MRTPDFFIIGAPKSGTTSLYHWVGSHPSVFMSPIREPCFFAPEVIDYTRRSREFNEDDAPLLRQWLEGPRTEPRHHGIVLDWNDYLSLFRGAGEGTILGEASGNYLHSWNAPVRIRERLPDARMIVMLRDPADRLFSHFTSAVAAGEAGGRFGDWIDAQLEFESHRTPRVGPIWTGMYACHLERWLTEFPRDQMGVFLYDDYRDDPVAVMKRVFAFLGVDAEFRVDVTRRFNVTSVPRWPALRPWVAPLKPVLRAVLPERYLAWLRARYRGPAGFRPTAADRSRLLRIYNDDVRELETLLGRDLAEWRDAAA